MRLITSFVTEDNPAIFHADPYLGGNVLLGLYLHIFLHEPHFLPRPSPTFALNLDQHQWSVIDFAAVHALRIRTPRSLCNDERHRSLKHAGQDIYTSESACRGYMRRQAVLRKCKCEPWWPPFENWPLSSTTTCGALQRGLRQAVKDITCMLDEDQRLRLLDDHENTSCIEPCQERHYDPHIHSNRMNMVVYEQMMQEHQLMQHLASITRACTDKDSKDLEPPPKERCEQAEAEVAAFLDSHKSMEAGAKFVNTFNDHFSEPFQPSAGFWRQAFPSISKLNDSDSDGITRRFLFLIVRPMDSNMQIDEEALVWSTGTTFAQLGGASSFIAGLTFVVVGELFELLFTVLIVHFQNCRKKNSSKGIPLSSNDQVGGHTVDLT